MESWKNLDKMLDDDRRQKEEKIANIKELLSYVDEGDKNEIKRMLLKGLSPNCSYEGISPLIACMQKNNLSLGIYFLTCGASASYQPDIKTENALWYALKNRKYEFLEMFCLNNCNVTRALGDVVPENPEDVPDSDVMSISNVEAGETALIYATKQSDVRMVEILLSHGKVRKKVNEIDRKGRTALHYCLGRQEMSDADIQISRLLLAAGADSAVVDFDGLTADKVAISDAAKSVLLNDTLNKNMDKVAPNMPEVDNDNNNDYSGPSFKI